MSSLILSRSQNLKGRFVPPGDKSISHRAIMFGALADGTSVYDHFLEAEDCLSTLRAFQSLGISIDWVPGSGKVCIRGKGMAGLQKPSAPLYLGNSGTTMRLLLGILAGQNFEAVLEGDPSLSSRPMQRVTAPLKQMGAQIKGKDKANFAPLTIRGGKLKGIEFNNQLGSAQVKSALLLAGLFAEGKTKITEKRQSRDHTERFLKSAGARFYAEGDSLVVEKTDSIRPLQGKIPGDISSAAFFITGAAMTPGSELTVENVCLNPTRSGFLEVLRRMGAGIVTEMESEIPEPIGKIHVKGSRLSGTRIASAEIPNVIDELPVLMTAMAAAEGESLISGAEELRVKETDRIHSMATNLGLLGAKIEELKDGVYIQGVEQFQGARVKSFDDHRTAMSMAVATLKMRGGMTLDGTECVNISFPGFFELFKRLTD